ncbi:hypothetical protein ACFL1N_11695 [Thermodesulfobacteriota bacterium]
MHHPNKNRLLEYYYKEGSDSEIHRTRVHIQDCVICREYFQTLEQTSRVLNKLQEQVPPKDTFDLMIEEMDILPKKPVQKRQIISALPYFQIALSIPFILAVLYYFQDKLSLLSAWEKLEKIWIIETLGSFGLVTIIFFFLGSFITMALAPVLLLDSEKLKDHIQAYKLSWR